MKLGQIYDLNSFQRFLDESAKAPGFTDAYTGIVLARNLTAVDPQIFEKKYPELSFVSSGIDADNTGGYAKRIESLRVREQGSFTSSKDETDNKGKISLTGEDNFLQVDERSSFAKWTDGEAKEAALQNINLVEKYVTAVNTIYMREIDEIGYLGIPDIASSVGLLNNTVFTATAAAGAIATLTAQQMYDAISGLITDQRNGVNNTPEYSANRVDMPVYVLNYLGITILNTTAGPASVLNALKYNFPGVEFRGTFRADDAGGVGVSHTVAYSNNIQAMKFRLPVPLMIGEIIKTTSWDYRSDYKYRVAGLDILESTAGRILTGL